jgi:Zn-dependent protease
MSSGPPYYTIWTPASPPPVSHRTSWTELTHIGIAFVVLTVDLVIILSGRGLLESGTVTGLVAPLSIYFVLLAVAAALTGFIAHEMAHKFVARRLGYWAEFRMWPMGLILSLITSAGGFLFAAPGATMVQGMDPRDVRRWGQTGLAGPVTNLVFAATFYSASLLTFRINSELSIALLFLAVINTLFATFNLLPFGLLDGAKVYRWGVGRWAAAFAVSAAFLVLSYTAFYYYGTPFLGA